MSLLVELIIYGVLAAGALFAVHTAWDGFKDRIGAPYADRQRAADQKVVNAADERAKAAETDRDTARGNTDRCEATLKIAQAATDEWSQAAAKADAAAKAQAAANDRDRKASAPYIADLQARAAAAPQLMACKDELAKTRATLVEAIKLRQRGAAK